MAGIDEPREAGLERVGEDDDADVGAHGAQARTTRAPCGPPATLRRAGRRWAEPGLDGHEQVAEPAGDGRDGEAAAVRSSACRPSATRRCSLKTTTPVRPARAIGACWAIG